MTDDELMVETVIDFLTRGHLDIHGGYPHDYCYIGNTLVVASLDHNGATEIETYQRADLLPWAKRAKEYAETSEYEVPGNEAFWETEPTDDVTA